MARDTPDPADDDEAAYHWAGDEVGGRAGPRLPSPHQVDAEVGTGADLATVDPTSRSRPWSMVLTAPFALAYLALTVGWILAIGYTSAGSAQLLPQLLWQFGEFTAIVAAPLWFGTVLLLTRGGRLGNRIGWLALGLGVLLPWPLLPVLVTA